MSTENKVRAVARWLPLSRRGIVAGVAALAALVITAAIGPLATAQEKTVVMAVEGEPGRLDPHTHALWLTFREVYLIFESFTQQDLSVANVDIPPIKPALAESWEISDDKKVYTFRLRQGVKFHDGTPWNAEAAKFNFDRVLKKDFQYFSELAHGFNTWWHQDIDSYEVVDEFTFRITLKQPNSELLRRMSMGGFGSAAMLSPESVKKYGNEDVSLHPTGTGPFKFVERVVNEKIVFEKNPDYWDKERIPRIDRLIIRGIPEAATRELALLTGEVDIIATPAPDSVDYLKAQGMTIIQAPVPTIYLMWINFKQKPLDDARVRKALYMSIDREGLCKFLRRGQCLPAYSVLNFGGPGHDPDYKPLPYDPDKAKQLLVEAGHPNGFEVRVDWTPGGAGDVATVADAEWIQRDWARIGVKLKIELFEISTYMQQMNKGMREGTGFMQLSWGENAFHWLDASIAPGAQPPNGFNAGWYNNPKVGELLAAARAAPNDQEMVAKLREMEKIVIEEDTAFIPTHSPLGVYAMSPKITGFILPPQHWTDLTLIDKTQ
jgi:peptide/nickel transport system substrate-binding protein